MRGRSTARGSRLQFRVVPDFGSAPSCRFRAYGSSSCHFGIVLAALTPKHQLDLGRAPYRRLRDGVVTADVSPKRVAGRPRMRADRSAVLPSGDRVLERAFCLFLGHADSDRSVGTMLNNSTARSFRADDRSWVTPGDASFHDATGHNPRRVRFKAQRTWFVAPALE
jgi:hypothetical protein